MWVIGCCCNCCCHLVGHPCTYVLYIMLGEGEWVLDVNEGCVEAYKYSAVVGIGL